MNQSMDGVGSSRRAARLAPGEIARLREHAAASGRPVNLAAKQQPQPQPQPAAHLAEAIHTEQLSPPTRRRHWQTIGSLTAGIIGLTLLVGGTVAGQSAGHPKAGSVLAIETAAAHATPMPVLDSALAEQQELQGILGNFVNSQKAPFYVYIKDLKTGATATESADVPVASASIYKLYVADRVYSLIDQNRLKLAQPTTGTDYDIGTCLGRMIKISDNDCGHYLGEMIGWGGQNPWLQDQGFTKTTLAQPQQTTATDVGLLLEKLYRNQLNTPSSDQALIDLMKAQIYDDRLRAGVPANTVVADKTGNLDGFVHDAGIIYGSRTDYAIVVMTGPWTAPGVAPDEIANLSRVVWGYLEN